MYSRDVDLSSANVPDEVGDVPHTAIAAKKIGLRSEREGTSSGQDLGQHHADEVSSLLPTTSAPENMKSISLRQELPERSRT